MTKLILRYTERLRHYVIDPRKLLGGCDVR